MPDKYAITYLSTAQKDLLSILEYIPSDNINAAADLVDEIDDKIGRLARHPRMGVIPKDTVLKSKGYRMLIVGNYLVFHVILKNKIEIRRVLHAKRNYRFLLE